MLRGFRRWGRGDYVSGSHPLLVLFVGFQRLRAHPPVLGSLNYFAGYIGAALWEIAPAMDRLDARWAGYYFDPRHAVAEGGGGAWKAANTPPMASSIEIRKRVFIWVSLDRHRFSRPRILPSARAPAPAFLRVRA